MGSRNSSVFLTKVTLKCNNALVKPDSWGGLANYMRHVKINVLYFSLGCIRHRWEWSALAWMLRHLIVLLNCSRSVEEVGSSSSSRSPMRLLRCRRGLSGRYAYLNPQRGLSERGVCCRTVPELKEPWVDCVIHMHTHLNTHNVNQHLFWFIPEANKSKTCY